MLDISLHTKWKAQSEKLSDDENLVRELRTARVPVGLIKQDSLACNVYNLFSTLSCQQCVDFHYQVHGGHLVPIQQPA